MKNNTPQKATVNFFSKYSVVPDKENGQVILNISFVDQISIALRFTSVEQMMTIFTECMDAGVSVWPDDPLMQEYTE